MKRWPEYALFLLFVLALVLAGTLSASATRAVRRQQALAALGRYLGTQAVLAPRYLYPAEPRLPAGFAAADLPLGGLTLDEAWAWFEQHRLTPLQQPVLLRLNDEAILLETSETVLRIDAAPIRQRMEELLLDWPPRPTAIYLGAGLEPPRMVTENVPLRLEVDEAALRRELEGLAARYRQDPLPLAHTTITTGTVLVAAGVAPFWLEGRPVAAFVAPVPGWQPDVEAALPAVAAALGQWQREPVALPLVEIPPPAPDLALLEAALWDQLEQISATVGIFVHDLGTGHEVAIHADTIFSGASVFKIAILAQVYRVLSAPPNEWIAQDLALMMIESDNDAADRLLVVGGAGDELRGLQWTTELLRRLGLPDSFLCNTYYGGLSWPGCPPEGRPAGPGALVTAASPELQTTPHDIGRLLVYIYQCSTGRGPLLARFPGAFTVAECQHMIALMKDNADSGRLVAGLPDIPAAHKSGWIDDMKADAGIVFSPGGSYVVSIFIWRAEGLPEEESDPWIARLSWIVYSFFNPAPRAAGASGP